MDKYIVRGVKKILSLTRTKIRLAEEAGTTYTRPRPLPLVKFLSGNEIETVSDAKDYREELVKDLNFSDSKAVASTVFQAMDIIEGVKYEFEPKELMPNISKDEFKDIEKRAMEISSPVNILLMTKDSRNGLNIFVGRNPPEGTLFLSGVPTSISSFLDFAFHSEYFHDNLRLRNINSVLGHKTLILNAIHFALTEFGAEGIE